MTFDALHSFFQMNWGWAAGLAASMLGLTLLAGSLLNPARKDEIALWLMGAQTEENWSRSFTSLFDAVFGERHLSLRCFFRSAVASLVAVTAIWLLIGNIGTLGLRIRSELSLGTVLVLALAVNVIADYVSLLETRLLLGRMPRSTLGQALVLILDLGLSAAIIWLAIFAFLRSPLNAGEIETFAEILGVFSVFSVLFYSTFLTSVWTWAYILSTWLMRAFTRLRVAALLDIEKQPIRILGLVLAGAVFLGALGVAAPLRKGPDGLTIADRTLCMFFKGGVCLDVARLPGTETARINLIFLACVGSGDRECLEQGLTSLGTSFEQEKYRIGNYALEVHRDWCEDGVVSSCTLWGLIQIEGLVLEPDFSEAERLLTETCRAGDATGCVGLAKMYSEGIGVKTDPEHASLLYRKSCEMGLEEACALAVALE